MKRLFRLALFSILLPTSGCPFFDGSSTTPTGDESVTHKEKDVSGKIALALGGVQEGGDEIVLDESLQFLDFQNEDPDLFILDFREGFFTYTGGQGAQVTPLEEGVGYVTPVVNGRERDPVQVTIPPQKLIQILIGEARGEMDREATLDDEENVRSSSVSVTGDAVGAVIRNRINLINETNDPALFVADPEDYESNPPTSYYEAVIEAAFEADGGTIYQFSPVDPEDGSNPFYLGAAERDEIGRTNLTAYDQAVLTAADIFNEDTEDPTGGAFGFYSPSAEEYEILQEALADVDLELPEGAGTSDSNFPALAPIQVLILTEVASSEEEAVPSFVFVRSRNVLDPAVTDEP